MESHDYPEHEKLEAIGDIRNTLGDFITWLNTQGLLIVKLEKRNTTWGESSEYFNNPYSVEQLLAMFYDVDLKKLAEEKDAMLEVIRTWNERPSGVT